METTKVPLSQCVESRLQNRKNLGDVSGLAKSIEVNGQITPLIVVADGDAYQIVTGHRRTAAMKELGWEEADAYVMDGWDDARIACVLNAENNHRRELTEAERGVGIQTMLSLGVPVRDAAISADIDADKAESYVKGSAIAPEDAVNLDFDAVALMGEYADVLTDEDVEQVLSKSSRWERESVCRKARARVAAEAEAERLQSEGVRVVERDELGEEYHACPGDCDHAGLVAVVRPYEWGERADVTFFCDDASHEYQPTPEEIADAEAYQKRCAVYDELTDHVAEFAKSIFPKFPGKGQTKLRQWAHEAFEARYECEPNDCWTDVKEPRGKALDQFILMRTIPMCVPEISMRVLKAGYEPWEYDFDDALSFVSFVDDILVPAGYEPTEGERELVDRLHGIFTDDDEESPDEADDEPPFDADVTIEALAEAA